MKILKVIKQIKSNNNNNNSILKEKNNFNSLQMENPMIRYFYFFIENIFASLVIFGG